MSKIAYMRKVANGFVPVSDMCEPGVFSNVKMGDIIKVDFKKPRDLIRHRKFFALLNLGYESWEVPDVSFKNVPAAKSFERFRSDIICMAGYYNVVASVKGEVRVEPKSISFGKMDETEFVELYNKCVNVILREVMKHYTREDLDNVIDQIIRF
jgi:hypothetical protein